MTYRHIPGRLDPKVEYMCFPGGSNIEKYYARINM